MKNKKMIILICSIILVAILTVGIIVRKFYNEGFKLYTYTTENYIGTHLEGIIGIDDGKNYDGKIKEIGIKEIDGDYLGLFHINDDVDIETVSAIMNEMEKAFPTNTIIPVNEWILKNWEKFDEEQKNSVRICSDFLETMESKVHALMNDDDIKLSLFVSLKKGEGSVLFKSMWQKMKNQGYKNMYLWTDCECNWQWYIKNGFTLVEESVYEKFSTETEKYKTYVFKKAIV